MSVISVKGSLHPIKSQKTTSPWLVIRLQMAVYWRHPPPSAFPVFVFLLHRTGWKGGFLHFMCHSGDGAMGLMDQNTRHTHSLPSMPFFGLCHVAARHRTAAPVCGRKALWLDTSQMLTRAYSLSLQWLAEDGAGRGDEGETMRRILQNLWVPL